MAGMLCIEYKLIRGTRVCISILLHANYNIASGSCISSVIPHPDYHGRVENLFS